MAAKHLIWHLRSSSSAAQWAQKALAASDKHTQPLPRLGKRQDASHEKVFCARGNAENLIKDMKRLTRSDKTACSRWQANQFRLPRRRQLAAAFAAASGAETVAVARRHLRVDPAHVRQSRRPRRAAERAHQARLSGLLTADRDARGHDGHNNDARPLSDAACAARAPIDHPERVPDVTDPAAVNTADQSRRPATTITVTNRMG